ncbi:MAG: glycosyltransferase family 2 protein [bacterium]|nr:glycosyltransferase family 2 protein [bacterium]
MTILFLLAGRASRFKEAGYTSPKSLIKAKGKYMIEWACDSLGFIQKKKFIFVCLREHEKMHHITSVLKSIYGDTATVLLTDGVTDGAAVSALLAKEHIQTDEELIISNADQYFKSKAFEEELRKKKKEYSGLIPVFEATHSRWSFAKLNEKGYVVEVAEKVPISNHATVGVYYFRHGKDFVWAAQEMIRKDIRRNNEFYVCPVFNELLGRGDKIKAVSADFMWSMGTPEDVLYFEKYFKGDRK